MRTGPLQIILPLLILAYQVSVLTISTNCNASQQIADKVTANSWRLRGLTKENNLRVLEPKDAPELYAAVGRIFSDVRVGQTKFLDELLESERNKKLQNPKDLVFQKLTPLFAIINVPEEITICVNFVSRKSPDLPYTDPEKPLILISTGFLAKMLFDMPNTGSFADSNLIVRRIAGALFHELAHPHEMISKPELRYSSVKQWINQQTSELYSDHAATRMAELAGYPKDAIIDALEAVFSGPPKVDVSMIDASLNTHPENAMRLTALRSSLTADRFAKGLQDSSARKLGVDPAQLFLEIQKASKTNERFKFANSFDEILYRLNTRDSLHFGSSLEVNLLKINFEVLLNRYSSQGMHIPEKTVLSIISNPAICETLIYKRETLQAAFPGAANVWQDPEVQAMLAESKTPAIFEDRRYLMQILNQSQFTKKSRGFEEHIGATMKFFDLPILVEGLLHEPIDGLSVKNFFRTFLSPGSGTYESQLLAKLASEDEILIKKRYLEEILIPQKIDLLTIDWLSGWKGRIPAIPQLGSNQDKFKNLWKQSESNPVLRTYLNEAVKFIFDNKGIFGYFDARTRSREKIDWDFVFAIFGIDRSKGYELLRSETIKAVKDVDTSSYDSQADFDFQVHTNQTSWTDESVHSAYEQRKNNLAENRISSAEFGKYLRSNRQYLTKVAANQIKVSSDLILSISNDDFLHKIIQNWLSHNADFDSFKFDDRDVTQSPPAFEIQAQLIDNLPDAEHVKRDLLRRAFLTKPTKWIFQNDDIRILNEILTILKRYNLAPDVLTILASIEDNHAGMEAHNQMFFFGEFVTSKYPNEFHDFLKATKDPHALIRLSKSLFDPQNADHRDREYGAAKFRNAPTIRAMKEDMIRVMWPYTLTTSERLFLWQALTATGPTPATDRYFSEAILPFLTAQNWLAHDINDVKPRLLTSIDEDGFYERSNRKAAAMKMLEQINELKGIQQALIFLNEMLRTPSKEKDEILEAAAYKYNISGEDLINLIERYKTTEDKAFKTHWTRYGSVYTRFAEGLSPELRADAIRYFSDYEPKALPYSLETELRHSYRKEMPLVDERTENDTAKIKHDWEQFQAKAEYMERIVPIEILLTTGTPTLVANADFPTNISRLFTSIKANSRDEKILRASLRALPERERSIVISYLVSLPNNGTSNLVRIIEALRVVGKKFGQFASVLQIFDPEQNEALAKVKDRAEPMSKAEIERIFNRDLGFIARRRIQRIVRVLGSASIKTVVEVELTNGEHVVAMVQPDDADQQVRTNLEIGRKFLSELIKEGVDLPSGLFNQIIQSMQDQLMPELDFRLEAQRTKAGKAIIESYNKNLTEGQYKMHVPELVDWMPVKKNIMFMTLVAGVSMDSLPEIEKASVGQRIIDVFLGAFYDHGWIEPDRHKGNFLIDVGHKTIGFIDLAQSEQFTTTPSFLPDERYNVAQFLRAISEEDISSIRKFAFALSVNGRDIANSIAEESVRRSLHVNSANQSNNKIIKIVDALANNGLKFKPKFLLTILKGFMMAKNENYIPTDDFDELMQQKVTKLLRHDKLPMTTLHELLRQRSNDCEHMLH